MEQDKYLIPPPKEDINKEKKSQKHWRRWIFVATSTQGEGCQSTGNLHFFIKSTKKKTEIGIPKSILKESNGKQKVADTGSNQEARKILPRKLARVVAQLNITKEPQVSKFKEIIDAPTQANLAKEKEKAVHKIIVWSPRK